MSHTLPGATGEWGIISCAVSDRRKGHDRQSNINAIGRLLRNINVTTSFIHKCTIDGQRSPFFPAHAPMLCDRNTVRHSPEQTLLSAKKPFACLQTPLPTRPLIPATMEIFCTEPFT
jgi:hypothetical protein